MAALITGIHVAHEKDQLPNFVGKRGKALGLTLGSMVFLGIVVFVIAAVPPLLDKAGFGTAGSVVFGVLRWPLLAVLMICGVSLLYELALKGKQGRWFGFLTPGAIVATIGWLVVSGGLRVLRLELLELQQDVRRAGLDRRRAALDLAQLAARADRRRGRRIARRRLILGT